MCEFHDCNCNGLGDMWWTDKCTYFSSIYSHSHTVYLPMTGELHPGHQLLDALSRPVLLAARPSIQHPHCDLHRVLRSKRSMADQLEHLRVVRLPGRWR